MESTKDISKETLIKALAWYYESIGEQVLGEYAHEVAEIAEICHNKCIENGDWVVSERGEKIKKVLNQ